MGPITVGCEVLQTGNCCGTVKGYVYRVGKTSTGTLSICSNGDHDSGCTCVGQWIVQSVFAGGGGYMGGIGHSVYQPGATAPINSTNNNNMTTLKEKFTLAFKAEPEKSFRKAGITNGDDFLTADGQNIFLSWLLKKHGDDFKKEVVDGLLEDIKAEK